MTIDEAYGLLYKCTLIVIGAGIIFALFRAIIGPRLADRLIGANMVSTLTVMAVGVLSFLLGESGLLDVDIIYTSLGFLAVAVLAKTFINARLSNESSDSDEGGDIR